MPKWELPEGVKRSMGGEPLYDMPPHLQGLLWSESLAGQEHPALWEDLSKLFTPKMYLESLADPWYLQSYRSPEGLLKVSMWPSYKKWVEERIGPWREAGADAQSGFLPEWEPFREELMGTLEEFAGMVPGMEEGFEGGLAARGMGGAGESATARNRDVYGPVARAGAQATRQSYTDYLQLYQRGRMAQEEVRQASISRLTGAEFQTQGLRQAQEAENLDRVLRTYLGEKELEIGYAGLEQQRRNRLAEVAMHRFEWETRWAMHQAEMEQREKERVKWWEKLLGETGEAAGYYFGSKGG